VFASTPFRPTGLATADQGLASVVQLLEWCSTLIADATDGHLSLDRAPLCDRELFAAIAAVLRQTGDLLAGQDGTTAWPDVGEMERRREASVNCHGSLDLRAATMSRRKSSRGAPFTPRRFPSPSAPWSAMR